MEPRLLIQSKTGEIQLCVTHPAGLVHGSDRREDYGVAFIPAAVAMSIYRRTVPSGYGAEKVKFILDNQFAVHVYEVPLVAPDAETAAFEVRNDAHVLAALVAAGVDPVPVVVHVNEAAKLAGV